MRIYEYWNLEDFDTLKKDVSLEEFEYKFNDCVKSRLISDVPVASLVSGGIDSSSLVYKMLELGDQDSIKLFFAQNKSQKVNEKQEVSYYYDFLKKKFKDKNIKLFSITNKIQDYWGNLEKVAHYNDEPCTFNNFHWFIIYQKILEKIKLRSSFQVKVQMKFFLAMSDLKEQAIFLHEIIKKIYPKYILAEVSKI